MTGDGAVDTASTLEGFLWALGGAGDDSVIADSELGVESVSAHSSTRVSYRASDKGIGSMTLHCKSLIRAK